MQLNRNGFLYVLDRTSGQLISAKPFERVNWASDIDMETGRPVETEIARRLRAGEQVELWPTQRGAKNWPHAAFNPEPACSMPTPCIRRGCTGICRPNTTCRDSVTSSWKICRPSSPTENRSATSMRSIR